MRALPTPYYDEGGITIYHGDCREILPALSADVMVTDPPYGIDHESAWQSSWTGTRIANDADTSVRDGVLATWGDRPAIVFGTWRKDRPGNARAVLIWDKGPASGMGDLRFPWKGSFEEVYVIGDGYVGSRDEGVIKGMTMVTWESQGRAHPNAKPVKLMRYLIGKCPPGTVLDPFMGSGTTLRAAKDLGRSAIGIEVEERYCEVAAKRLGQEVLDFGEAA
jgi:site-specific DNA-methyltransferase (adenine-specific)